MIYAAVLAGGKGLRMGGDVPKQFINIAGKPIIIRSIEAFVDSGSVDKIFVAVPYEQLDHTRELIKKYIKNPEIEVVCGGSNRNETLFNVLNRINIKDDDIILTHDAVRPFIDKRIIDENIVAAEKYGACNTVVPAVDTIISSDDGNFISNVLRRDKIFHAQTPQSFRLKELYELYASMSPEEFENYTDACTVFVANGKKVFLVAGDRNNIKITYPEDAEKAENIISGRLLTEQNG